LVYRYSLAKEFKGKEFLKQFNGKTEKDPIRIGKDIKATSAVPTEQVAFGVRKMLVMYDELKEGKGAKGVTLLENVELPALFSENRDKKRKAKELLELMGLSGRENHLPSQLSGGEMQRVAIARALINEPKILLADEPTGNLDSQNAKIIIEIFKKLNQKGLTIIVVTHNIELAQQAKTMFHLKDGKVLNHSK